MRGLHAQQHFPGTVLVHRNRLMLARIEQFVGDGRLVGQLRQFVQLAVQSIHFRDFQHVARVVQPDLDALDARQLLGQIFRLLLIALQLQRYQQQPEDLAEQLPRIERIQVWLHHARNVLEIPEMDRLYGELNKLAQLANEPTITDELLDARKHQAIAVYQNRAWKMLLRM